MSTYNVARIGKFSSDRAIQEYCKDIWDVTRFEFESPDALAANKPKVPSDVLRHS
jgi:starch phosphorylase